MTPRLACAVGIFRFLVEICSIGEIYLDSTGLLSKKIERENAALPRR